MSDATLRLFKALPIEGRSSAKNIVANSAVNAKTIPKGFVFSPEVVAAYPNLDSVIKTIDDLYGADPEALNKSFHKSFAKVRDASTRTLIHEQITHYFTTYGREIWGLYDAARVYIPAEYLNVPDIDIDRFSLVVIRGMTADELKVALLDFLSTGAALSEQSVTDALEVASMVSLTDDEIDTVKNREVLVGLYELYGKVPANPVEFLRYVVYRTTGETLLIKSKQAVNALKDGAQTHSVLPLFNLYKNAHGLDRLAEVFLRFKPLFLALRSDKAMRPTINKIRRLAETSHKPMAPDYLNSVTAQIKGSTVEPVLGKMLLSKYAPSGVDYDRLRTELQNPRVNIFRKIRLAQALRIRTAPDLDAIVYKIRNGKSFASDFTPFGPTMRANLNETYNVVIEQIAADLSKTLAGKRIYIPDGVIYGLPSTEKQFLGNYPAGTYVQVHPSDALVAGIYWEDTDGRRTDLDLSMADEFGRKIGWDAAYRSGDNTVLFSGDNTSAPSGASEVFWIGPSARGSYLMSVNLFDGPPEVPFKIVIGTAHASDINSHFTFNPNNLVASAASVLDTRQQDLGVILADPKGSHRFYLGATSVGGGISARHGVNAERTRKFMQTALLSAPTFNEAVYYAGATLVDRPEDADEGFDLSPSAIDKTTFLSMLAGKVAA